MKIPTLLLLLFTQGTSFACLASDTLVLMDDGEFKTVRVIGTGNSIIGYSQTTGKEVVDKIETQVLQSNDLIWKIEFDFDNDQKLDEILFMTGIHAMIGKNGEWISVDRIKSGVIVRGRKEALATVLSRSEFRVDEKSGNVPWRHDIGYLSTATYNIALENQPAFFVKRKGGTPLIIGSIPRPVYIDRDAEQDAP